MQSDTCREKGVFTFFRDERAYRDPDPGTVDLFREKLPKGIDIGPQHINTSFRGLALDKHELEEVVMYGPDGSLKIAYKTKKSKKNIVILFRGNSREFAEKLNLASNFNRVEFNKILTEFEEFCRFQSRPVPELNLAVLPEPERIAPKTTSSRTSNKSQDSEALSTEYSESNRDSVLSGGESSARTSGRESSARAKKPKAFYRFPANTKFTPEEGKTYTEAEAQPLFRFLVHAIIDSFCVGESEERQYWSKAGVAKACIHENLFRIMGCPSFPNQLAMHMAEICKEIMKRSEEDFYGTCTNTTYVYHERAADLVIAVMNEILLFFNAGEVSEFNFDDCIEYLEKNKKPCDKASDEVYLDPENEGIKKLKTLYESFCEDFMHDDSMQSIFSETSLSDMEEHNETFLKMTSDEDVDPEEDDDDEDGTSDEDGKDREYKDTSDDEDSDNSDRLPLYPGIEKLKDITDFFMYYMRDMGFTLGMYVLNWFSKMKVKILTYVFDSEEEKQFEKFDSDNILISHLCQHLLMVGNYLDFFKNFEGHVLQLWDNKFIHADLLRRNAASYFGIRPDESVFPPNYKEMIENFLEMFCEEPFSHYHADETPLQLKLEECGEDETDPILFSLKVHVEIITDFAARIHPKRGVNIASRMLPGEIELCASILNHARHTLWNALSPIEQKHLESSFSTMYNLAQRDNPDFQLQKFEAYTVAKRSPKAPRQPRSEEDKDRIRQQTMQNALKNLGVKQVPSQPMEKRQSRAPEIFRPTPSEPTRPTPDAKDAVKPRQGLDIPGLRNAQPTDENPAVFVTVGIGEKCVKTKLSDGSNYTRAELCVARPFKRVGDYIQIAFKAVDPEAKHWVHHSLCHEIPDTSIVKIDKDHGTDLYYIDRKQYDKYDPFFKGCAVYAKHPTSGEMYIRGTVSISVDTTEHSRTALIARLPPFPFENTKQPKPKKSDAKEDKTSKSSAASSKMDSDQKGSSLQQGNVGGVTTGTLREGGFEDDEVTFRQKGRGDSRANPTGKNQVLFAKRLFYTEKLEKRGDFEKLSKEDLNKTHSRVVQYQPSVATRKGSLEVEGADIDDPLRDPDFDAVDVDSDNDIVSYEPKEIMVRRSTAKELHLEPEAAKYYPLNPRIPVIVYMNRNKDDLDSVYVHIFPKDVKCSQPFFLRTCRKMMRAGIFELDTIFAEITVQYNMSDDLLTPCSDCILSNLDFEGFTAHYTVICDQEENLHSFVSRMVKIHFDKNEFAVFFLHDMCMYGEDHGGEGCLLKTTRKYEDCLRVEGCTNPLLAYVPYLCQLIFLAPPCSGISGQRFTFPNPEEFHQAQQEKAQQAAAEAAAAAAAAAAAPQTLARAGEESEEEEAPVEERRMTRSSGNVPQKSDQPCSVPARSTPRTPRKK